MSCPHLRAIDNTTQGKPGKDGTWKTGECWKRGAKKVGGRDEAMAVAELFSSHTIITAFLWSSSARPSFLFVLSSIRASVGFSVVIGEREREVAKLALERKREKRGDQEAGTSSNGSSSMLILGNGEEEAPQQLPRGEEERLRGSILCETPCTEKKNRKDYFGCLLPGGLDSFAFLWGLSEYPLAPAEEEHGTAHTRQGPAAEAGFRRRRPPPVRA